MLLRDFTPEWNADAADPLAAALIAIFARYSEIIIQRLNEAPRKNFLASWTCSELRCCRHNRHARR